MTPQRWKGAGILLLAVAAVLVVLALVSVLTATPTVPEPIAIQPYPSTSALGLLDAVTGVLRGVLFGVVLGAFAGVAFFLGLASFMWSALAEAKQQRAEMLAELSALRER